MKLRTIRRLRRLRGRMTLWLLLITTGVSILSLVLSTLLRSRKPGDARIILMFGMAARDVLLLLGCFALVLCVVLLFSRSPSNPIEELTEAARQIADGNFDVQVELDRDRVAEYGDLQRNFNRMARELASNETLRRDFISNVSHELRTPLSVINGYAKLLEDPALSPAERMEYARLIDRESERLSNLTSNMLRLAKLENQVIPSQDRLFSLDELIRQCLLRLESRWSPKNLALNLDLAPVEFTGDEDLITHVFSNLIDNAIKFTPDHGSIALTLHTQDKWIVAKVADTGCGFDDTEAERIFEQFYQGDSSRSREGSGLGLPLARRITELHGGTLTAESTPGRGSTFIVRLPAAPGKS